MSEFIPFRFKVNLFDGESGDLLCKANFSEVQGLEFTMEPRAIQEGGQNWGEAQRVGLTKFSPIVLKRGFTESHELWSWFDASTRQDKYSKRLFGNIEIKGSTYEKDKGLKVAIVWHLGGILITRFKGPDLSSTANQVAIEEVTLVVESLTLEKPTGESANA